METFFYSIPPTGLYRDLKELAPEESSPFSMGPALDAKPECSTQPNEPQSLQHQRLSRKKHLFVEETSVEDQFLTQHLKAFEVISQNFVENGFDFESCSKNKLLIPQIFAASDSKPVLTCYREQLQSFPNALFTSKEREQWLIQLSAQKMLDKFFEATLEDQCYQDLAEELLYLGFKTWEYSLTLKRPMEKTYSEIIQLAHQFVEQIQQNISESQTLKELSSVAIAKGDLSQTFHTFIKKYVETVLLIVCEHFINPNKGEAKTLQFEDEIENSFSDNEEDEDELFYLGAANKKVKSDSWD